MLQQTLKISQKSRRYESRQQQNCSIDETKGSKGEHIPTKTQEQYAKKKLHHVLLQLTS